MEPGLRTEGLTKAYGPHTVLADVSLAVTAGEVVAVIGENGAGKSTLAKCLSGATSPSAGTIQVDGQVVVLDSPRAAAAHGIAYLPQEPQHVLELSVAENLLLGRWPSRRGLALRGSARSLARSELARMGVELDVSAPMSSLRPSERQLVEIVRALGSGARVVLLDEPTAALHRAEADRLYTAVGRLAEQGVAILFISHRLDEVQRFSDRVAVLRNGSLVATLPTAEATRATLIGHMLGHAAVELTAPAAAADRPLLLEAVGLSAGALAPIDLAIGRGEIVGLFGVRGSGADVVAEVLGGRRDDAVGQLRIAGIERHAPRNPRAAIAAGIAYVPADRKAYGVISVLSVQKNANLLVSGRVSSAGVVRRRRDRREAAELAERFDVRHRGLGLPIDHLSGGNQQKVLLGSRAALARPVLVLHEPTQGVDVGARLRLHELIRKMATAGTGVLLVTSDVEEAALLSDRLLVIRDGRLAGELHAPGVTQEAALRLATAAEEAA